MRNRYEKAGGVTVFGWHEGRPNEGTRGVVLVEIWTPTLSFFGALPGVSVSARVEVWVLRDDGAQSLTHGGRLLPIEKPYMVNIRRWTRLPTRHWNSTVKIDGWNATAGEG